MKKVDAGVFLTQNHPKLQEGLQHALLDYTQFRQQYPEKLVVLIHKAPSHNADITGFVRSHTARIHWQVKAAASNPSIATPLACGFSPRLNSFITLCALPRPATMVPLPRDVGATLFAALERAFMQVWTQHGVEFTRINPHTIFVDRQALRVAFTDVSSIQAMPQWTQQIYANPGSARLESLYASSNAGDARFLRKLYAALPPKDDPAQRNSLVNIARAGMA